MKKHISFALIIAFLFIAWLFTNAFLNYKTNLMKISKNPDEYVLYVTDLTSPIILNKKTGEVYRYYRNMKESEIESEGFIRLNYETFFGPSETPSASREHIKAWLKAQAQKNKEKNIK